MRRAQDAVEPRQDRGRQELAQHHGGGRQREAVVAANHSAESLTGRIRIDGIAKASSAAHGGSVTSQASSRAIGGQRATAAIITFR